jgi:hypothetical protein
MKLKNVHNFPTTHQQKKKSIFVAFRFIILIVVVRKGKEKNEIEFFSIEN